MKLIYLLAILFSFKALAGFPPTSLKGQSQASAITTFGFQVPNNQATKTSTGSLIETGSQNLLSNPGFEHSTISTGWNVTNGTLSSTATTPFGAAAASFTGSIANGNIQSTTGSGTAQAGLNCLVSAYIKTSSSNVQLCAIHNGTLNTNLCVSVNANNAWALYQMPTVCDATSTVARVRITTSVSTTFAVDNVYVGVNPNFGSVAQAQIAGSSYFPGTTSCTWTRSSATIGAFGTTAACPGPTIISQNLGAWQTTDSDLPRQTIANLPAGKYKATFILTNYLGANSYAGLTISDGITTCKLQGSSGTGNQLGTVVFCYFSYDSTQSSVTFELQGAAVSGNTITIQNGVTAPDLGTNFLLEYYPPSSAIVSTTNQDYDWTAYTPTFTGLGTVTNISFFHKRVGSDLHIRGKWTNGTRTATEMRISIPSGLTSLSSLATIELAGRAVWGGGSYGGTYEVLIEPSVSYMTFGYSTSASGALAKVNGDTIWSASSTQSLYAKIPIQGWNNNNVIVGTFENSFGTWSSETSITIGGTTTAPTKGTIVADKVKCRKTGKDWYECEYRYSHTSGGVDGSGDYLFSLPSGYTFDTTETPSLTSALSNTVATILSQIESDGFVTDSSLNVNKIKAIVYSSSQFRVAFPASTTSYFGTSYFNFAKNPLAFFYKIRFKGTGPNN